MRELSLCRNATFLYFVERREICGLYQCTVWGSQCLRHRNLKQDPNKLFMTDLSKLSWHLAVCRCLSCHSSASADWAVKTGKRRGGFLTRVRPGLEKHAWWVHGRYFWVFQARHWRGSGDLWSAGHSLACPAKLSGSEGGSRLSWPNAWDPVSHSDDHTVGGVTQTGADCSMSETVQLLQDNLHAVGCMEV